jgi:glutamate 5-kinase
MARIGRQGASEASRRIAAARRIVVKVGSSLVIADGGARAAWMASLAADLAGLIAAGRQVLLVTSGAVALGRPRLGLARAIRLEDKQAAAAAGQALLMQAWEDALAPHGVPTAQLLLTFGDTEQRRRWLNVRATLSVLLARKALPVINENDSVATDELRYGDNDRLSARVAQMVGADLLILFSDVDGLYTADPARDSSARRLDVVAALTDEIEGFAGGASTHGSGGMRTKLAAARIARAAGCATLIASGREDHPLRRLMEGAPATLVTAEGTPKRAYKQWIAGTLSPGGSMTVDAGAAAALAAGRSLLPAGLAAVSGDFERGECVAVLDPDGREIARGIAAYGADEARLLIGCPKGGIAARLGYARAGELIHRDDLAMSAP